MSFQAVESSAALVMSIAAGGLLGALSNVVVHKLWKYESATISKYSSTNKKLVHLVHAFLPPFLVALVGPAALAMLPWDGATASVGLMFAFIGSSAAFISTVNKMTMHAFNKVGGAASASDDGSV